MTFSIKHGEELTMQIDSDSLVSSYIQKKTFHYNQVTKFRTVCVHKHQIKGYQWVGYYSD